MTIKLVLLGVSLGGVSRRVHGMPERHSGRHIQVLDDY